MTLVIKDCPTAEEAFHYLVNLGLDEGSKFYFRGHRDESWDLTSTYGRHRTTPHEDQMPDLDEMIDHFIGSIVSTGKRLPFDLKDRRAKLEYARHYGLPSPLIDWTYSPYVALFFAFNGTRDIGGRKGTRSVVYALDMNGLADLTARSFGGRDNYSDLYRAFSEPMSFEKGYPGRELRFLNLPASWNVRMTRQMGAFLYDTLSYRDLRFSGLEEFIKNTKETDGSNGPTLHKVYISHSQGKSVFMRLDLAGITGTRLMDDYEGAVADAVNAYNYNRKSGYFWDVGEANAKP